MAASDHDRSLELAASHHLVEHEPRLVALTVAEPANARRKPLELEALAGPAEPMLQALVVGEEFEHRLVGGCDVRGIARQCCPAERPAPLAEGIANERRHEAGIPERFLEAAKRR